jgi:prepilin-type N-terminal cleavage/methylation domain-containing protein
VIGTRPALPAPAPAVTAGTHGVRESVAAAGRRSVSGFTFLELLVVMALVAMLLGLTIGWLGNIGRTARSAQAASIVTETAFRCQNMSAGGRRATMELRVAKDADGNERLVCRAAAQRPILTANFEPPPRDKPELDWFVSAAGDPDTARPVGNVRLVDEDGKTAVALQRGGHVEFGARSGFAVTDGMGVDVLVKPAGGAATMTLLKCGDTTQPIWRVQLVKDAVSGPEVYAVVLSVWTVAADAPPGAITGAGKPFRTPAPCVPAGVWSRLQISYDGREASIKVEGVERLKPVATRGKGPPVEPPAERFTATANGVAPLQLSAAESPFVGSVDTLEVTGVFRSNEDERDLRDVEVLRPALPLRVVYANGRLDPSRHLSDVLIWLVSPKDPDSGTAYEVRLGLYGDIPPPRRTILGGGAPAPGGPAAQTTPAKEPR